jgi:hypothetical protein
LSASSTNSSYQNWPDRNYVILSVAKNLVRDDDTTRRFAQGDNMHTIIETLTLDVLFLCYTSPMATSAFDSTAKLSILQADEDYRFYRKS